MIFLISHRIVGSVETERKRLVTTFLPALFFFQFLFCPFPVFADDTILKVGVYNNSPSIFIDANGEAKGLFIDILEDVARHEEWRIEYIPGQFSVLLDQLTASKIDLLPGVAYSRKREEIIDFTYETVMANWAELYVQKGKNLTSMIELEGKKIAVKYGDIHFQALEERTKAFNINCRFLETDEYEMVFEMLHGKYVDVGAVNRLYGNKNRKEFDVQETPVIFNPIEMRYAAPEGKNDKILAKLDSYLIAFKADEESVYYESVTRWFKGDVEGGEIPEWFIYLVSAGFGIVLVLIMFTLLLKLQVRTRTEELVQSNRKLEQEIKERKKVEDKIRRFARIVESSTNATALIDLNHSHILSNNFYKRMVAVKVKNVESLSVQEVFGDTFYETILESAISKCMSGETVDLQTGPGEHQGQNINWNISLSPYNSESGTINGYVIDIRDVTSHVALQNRLKNAQKMEAIGLLAGGVAHDLNNILSGIVSYPDMLLLNLPVDDPMVQPLGIIKKSGERAAAIVQDLLALARRGIVHVEPLNLNEVISEFLISPEYTEIVKDLDVIEVWLLLGEGVKNIVGSSVHLSKVLMNLFVNSVEAMPEGGVLTITTGNWTLESELMGYESVPEGKYAIMTITDNGVGMKRSEMNRIFEPFYSSKLLGRSGTGLGMAVVWGTVKDHNGYIDIASTKGKGTMFTIYFPATEEKVIRQAAPELESYMGQGQKILVVDDIEEQRTLAREVLEKLGYNVRTAPSGESGVAMCREADFDLIVLDMIMPGGMDGCSTYEEIVSFKPGQKAIVASGFSDSASIRKVHELGVGDYVKKPYSVATLGVAVWGELNRNR